MHLYTLYILYVNFHRYNPFDVWIHECIIWLNVSLYIVALFSDHVLSDI